VSDLDALIEVREELYGPRLRSRLVKWLRGPRHGAGDKRGRLGVGKRLLRLTSRWPLRLIWELGCG
jgi:hypothetical protein